MLVIGDNVMVRFKDLKHQSVQFGSGELAIDPSWNIADHVVVEGTVISKGIRVKTNVELFDNVYVSYFAVLMATGKYLDESVEYANERYIEMSDGVYVVLNEKELFFSIRDGKIVNLNDRILVKRCHRKVESTILIIPDFVKDQVIPNCGEVVNGSDDFPVGSTVIFPDHHMERVGYSLHNRVLRDMLGEKEEIFSVRKDSIHGILFPN